MSVRVAVRFRPDLEHESDEIEENLLIYPQLNCVNVARHFNLYFHDVLPLYSTQDEVFNIVQPLVDDFLQGNNISIITYGPRGCGKTYTMFGHQIGHTQTNPENVYRLGLMPRVISYIFDQLQQRFNPINGEFIHQLQCTFAEIFNKKIIDLLNPYHKHKHRNSNGKQSKKKRVKFIQKQNGTFDYANLTKVTISSIADVLRYMYTAFHNRKYVRKYNSNDTGQSKYKQSKSHCVAQLKLIFKKKESNEMYKVSMVFIDCAAYIKSNESNIDSQYINRAFLSLGNVITGLHRQAQDSGHNNSVWKENILTQSLHSLMHTQSQSKILLFLNCSISSNIYEETLATLRFGNLAMTDPMLLNVMDSYRKKIKALQHKKSKDGTDSNEDDKERESARKKDFKIKKLVQELNNLRSENNENVSKLEYKTSQIAAVELSMIDLKTQLLRLQTNEQILRDENEDYCDKLNEINSIKEDKLQFIDANLMKRTSIIHSTIDKELSAQLTDLQNLKAELQLDCSKKESQISELLSNAKSDKSEILSLRDTILDFQTNSIPKSQFESEQKQLFEQIRDRDFRIAEYERDIKEKVIGSANWAQTQKTYEQTIKQLQSQLRESKDIISKQHNHNALGHSNNNNKYESEQMQKSNINSSESEQIIQNLKLEIARIQSNVFETEQIAKLKRKNNALEARLIKARSEKAKMLPQLLREKTKLKSELIEMKTTLALSLVKWKFVEKKYIKQIRDLNSDLERYQKKLNTQIKGKRKLGNQMELLDKIAQDTVKTAIHQRVISSLPTNASMHQNFDFSLGSEKESLPQNLQRVQNVIKDLTTKLHKKQTRITELENKMALYEFSISRTSNIGGDMSAKPLPFMRNPSMISQYGIPNVAPVMNDDTTKSGYNMFTAFSSTMTELNLQSLNSSHSPIAYAGMDEKEEGSVTEQSMIANQEQYLKAFLTTQKTALPDKTLSVGFFINNGRNNTRLSVDVNHSFYAILEELNVKKPSKLKDLELHITFNPQPMSENIIVTHDLMHKTFWELILEFGVFSLLKFSVFTNAMQMRSGDINSLQINQKNAKKSSIFKRFKSKKNVSK